MRFLQALRCVMGHAHGEPARIYLLPNGLRLGSCPYCWRVVISRLGGRWTED